MKSGFQTANTLAAHAVCVAAGTRDGVRTALRELGLREAARPEELTPPQWRAFAAALGAEPPA